MHGIVESLIHCIALKELRDKTDGFVQPVSMYRFFPFRYLCDKHTVYSSAAYRTSSVLSAILIKIEFIAGEGPFRIAVLTRTFICTDRPVFVHVAYFFNIHT